MSLTTVVADRRYAIEQLFANAGGERVIVRVMGVDPGLTRCGLSMIEGRGGRQVTALDVDVVRTPAGDPLQRRLLAISDVVDHWMDTHVPDVIAIERVFANQNANTAMGTAQAAGVIALALLGAALTSTFTLPAR